MACVRCNIRDLTLNANSFFINALVIAKTEKKTFNMGRSVITFTVRDTKLHFINCSVWGSEPFIENCARAYKIGDVISIYRPSVKQKNQSSSYHPRTTSPFELIVSENRAYIHRVNEEEAHLLQLQNEAVKSTTLALRLDDVVVQPGEEALTADLVVLVRAIEAASVEVQTKNGPKKKRKVCFMDTTTQSIPMTVWHTDYLERMDHWKPLETILHLVDVRVEYSQFERSTVLSLTSKTIIVENPKQSSRSNEILAFIHTMSLEKINELKTNQLKPSIDVAAIKQVMSVRRILEAIERDRDKDVAAIVYGVITKFDINAALIRSCANCKRMLFKNGAECENQTCAAVEFTGPKYVDRFYMAVTVADHSGSLNCRITDEYGQKILGRTAQELKSMSEDELDDIFNRFSLERFCIKVIVRPKLEGYFANIVSIEVEQPCVMAKALKP